mgnify:CR=1 FL=1
MPVKGYFGGHGTEVMADMKKKHGKRGKEVFYATANKYGQKPKSHSTHGAIMAGMGDVGTDRQREGKAVSETKLKGVSTIDVESYFSNKPVREALDPDYKGLGA